MRHVRRARAVDHGRRFHARDGVTHLRRIEQVHALPRGQPRDVVRRICPVHPPDDVDASGQDLDDMAARETGGTGDEDGHLQRRVSYWAR